MTLWTRLLALGCVAVFSLVGCGNACEDAIERMCERACDCGGCKTVHGGENASATFTWSDATDCSTLYQQACDKETIDGDACDGAVDGAKCDSAGLHVPDACNE